MRKLFFDFLRVGLCSHTVFFCRPRGRTAGVGSDHDGWDPVDPSPRDRQIKHVLKYIVSEKIARLTFRHVDTSWASDLRWDEDHVISIGRPRDRAIEAIQSTWVAIWRPREALFGKIGGALDSDRTASAACGRTPRSRPDRTAIAAWSSRDRGDFAVKSSPVEWMVIEEGLIARSTPIKARSWRKSWPFWRLIWSPIRADFSWNWSHDAAPKDSFPRRLQTTSTTAPSPTIVGLLSSLKPMYFPLLFRNFWSIHEGIKQILRNILSSSWFPRV